MLKRHFPQVKDTKYDHFKEVLINYNYDSLEESWENVPDSKELAEELGITKQKVYKLIKDFYFELLFIFNVQNPIEVKRYTHQIYIGVPYDEMRECPNQKYAQGVFKKSKIVYVQLPVAPRIGEHIDLSFVDDKKFTLGYVHNVRHEINGDSIVIHIDVHPFKNFCAKWQELKEDYDFRKRVERSRYLQKL